MTDKPLSSRPTAHVPLLDSRASTRCPMRTHLDLCPPPGERVEVPLPTTVVARMEAGRAFEDQVMAELEAQLGSIPSFLGNPEGASAAMAEGVGVLAQVPLVDEAGRRTGRPDLLVRLPRDGEDGRPCYLPVDVKAHLVAQTRKGGAAGPLRAIPHADLTAPLDVDAVHEDADRWARRNLRDLMTLAHQHRLLQAAGHAGPRPFGGIIGADRLLVLHDLDVARFASWRNSTGRWTALQKYDREFGFRRDVASLAVDLAEGRTDEAPTVVPARNSDCPTCPHQPWCDGQMESADELTLLPGITWDRRHHLHAEGITTRTQLAACDPTAMSPATVALAVDHARVVVAGAAMARRRGIGSLVMPTADVQVDVDMESTRDGRVYLWGALHEGRYVAFDDLSEDLDDHALFVRFWTWLMQVREEAVAQGQTFAAHCWSGPAAENRYLRLYGPAAGVDVEAFIGSPDWVDLEAVVKRHLVTGTGTSLKTIARLAGFRWRADDAGGDQSMLWWEQATAGDAEAARTLLDYNEDDVRAQAAVREHLLATWPQIPPVEDLGPTPSTPRAEEAT